MSIVTLTPRQKDFYSAFDATLREVLTIPFGSTIEIINNGKSELLGNIIWHYLHAPGCSTKNWHHLNRIFETPTEMKAFLMHLQWEPAHFARHYCSRFMTQYDRNDNPADILVKEKTNPELSTLRNAEVISMQHVMLRIFEPRGRAGRKYQIDFLKPTAQALMAHALTQGATLPEDFADTLFLSLSQRHSSLSYHEYIGKLDAMVESFRTLQDSTLNVIPTV